MADSNPVGALQLAYMLQNPAAGMQLQQQQALANQMMQEGATQPDPNSEVSGHAVAFNPWGGLARMGERLAGAYQTKANNQKLGEMMQGATGGGTGANITGNPYNIGDIMAAQLNPEAYKAKLQLMNAGPVKAAETSQTPQNMNGHIGFVTPPGMPQQPNAAQPAQNPQSLPSPPPQASPMPSGNAADTPAKPVNLSGNAGQNIDWNNPAAAKGATTAADKGAESGNTYQDKLVEDASHAIEGKRIVEQMRRNVGGFEPGKLANAKADLNAWGQSLGFDKKYLDSQLGSVADVQSFNKLTAQLAIQAIKQISPKATQMEFQKFLENNPNPSLTPGAMTQLLDYTGKTFDIPLDKQKSFNAWKKTNSLSNYSDFDSNWNQQMLSDMPGRLAMPESPGNTPSASPQSIDPQSIVDELRKRGHQIK